MQFRTHVNTAATTFSKENYSSLHQKLKYLRALFDAMEGEQADLLTEGNELWTNVTKAEQDFKAAQQQSASSEWQLAVDLFAQALENVEQYTEKTKLLDPLQWQLHFARGTIRIEEKLDGGLEDIMYCVEAPLEGGNMAQVHFLRATALSSLGNMEDAKEALAKACMIAPKNEEWKEQLESWKSS
jgi:tetratricopeptide (TPR) repeat protein